MAKTHCNRPLPGSALFCPQCGTNLGDPTYTLDEMLDAQHLHLGHDYRVRVTNAMGRLLGVRHLGASEAVIDRFRRCVPGLSVTELSRQPGVGDSSDWLRVDLDVKE